jgi:hypothetical protein
MGTLTNYIEGILFFYWLSPNSLLLPLVTHNSLSTFTSAPSKKLVMNPEL